MVSTGIQLLLSVTDLPLGFASCLVCNGALSLLLRLSEHSPSTVENAVMLDFVEQHLDMEFSLQTAEMPLPRRQIVLSSSLCLCASHGFKGSWVFLV